MADGPKLELRQSQSLVMTQQLQQSIKLLQLSAVEINEFVETELEKNPLLTSDESQSDAPSSPVEQQEEPAARDASEMDSLELSREDRMDGGEDSLLDTNRGEESWEYDPGYVSERSYSGGGGGGYSEEGSSIEQTASREKTLREHLHEQLQVDIDDPQQRMIGAQLIEMLDESGYFREEAENVCEQLGIEAEELEATLAVLQRFDPQGVFARDLQECLAIQLRERDRFDPAMRTLIEHLELIGKGELDKLQKLCSVDDEDFADMLAEIRALNPRPSINFQHEHVQAIVPDVFVRRKKEGGWQVELNQDVLPRVLLNREYHQDIADKARDKEEKKYLSEQLSNANWLVKALDQRAQTILKVSSEIVRQQEMFLLYGIRYLKPLTLKDIAVEVDLHESTVSRVTTNKYMATGRGIYELKYFFTSSLPSSGSSAEISSKTVMFYIRELIDEEAADAILSDDAIVTALKERGVDVARRTVAKYRDEMQIPSSVVRRRQKASRKQG